MEEEESKPPPNDTETGVARSSDVNGPNEMIPEPLVLRSGQSEAIVSLASKKPRRVTKRGWGPFQSVVKERSVDFNLTLDVNSLRQEVQHLTRVRDLQRSKSLIQRHSPEGSLAKMVHEYFRVFQHGAGAVAPPTSLVDRRRHRDSSADTGATANDKDEGQLQFLRRMMDDHVDFGFEARGPDALYDFIQRTCVSHRLFTLSLDCLEAFDFGETVIIETRVTLRFQVTITTIKARFPHISTFTRLVTSLLGRNIETKGRILFYFDERDKCVKYSCDMDFASAFSNVLEPRDLAAVLHSSHLDGSKGSVDYALPRRAQNIERSSSYQHGHHQLDVIRVLSSRQIHEEDWQNVHRPQAIEPSPVTSRLVRSSSSHTLYPATTTFNPTLNLVNEYFRCFESAFILFDPEVPGHHARFDLVRAYMSRSFTSDMRYGHHLAGWSALERRWASLCDSFELRAFRAEGPPRDITVANSLPHQPRIVIVRAVYSLHITPRTISRVFPRLVLAHNDSVQRQLLGQTLSVPAQLTFSLELVRSRPLIARIDEHEQFSTALRSLLLPFESVDADAVLVDARLVENGLEGAVEGESFAVFGPNRVRSSSEPASDRSRRARMSFSDLLGG